MYRVASTQLRHLPYLVQNLINNVHGYQCLNFEKPEDSREMRPKQVLKDVSLEHQSMLLYIRSLRFTSMALTNGVSGRLFALLVHAVVTRDSAVGRLCFHGLAVGTHQH